MKLSKWTTGALVAGAFAMSVASGSAMAADSSKPIKIPTHNPGGL
jgi:hypothetical protein